MTARGALRIAMLGLALGILVACHAVRLGGDAKNQDPEPRKPSEEGEGVPGYFLDSGALQGEVSGSSVVISGRANAVAKRDASTAVTPPPAVMAFGFEEEHLEILRQHGGDQDLAARFLGEAAPDHVGAFRLTLPRIDGAIVLTVGGRGERKMLLAQGLTRDQAAAAYAPRFSSFHRLDAARADTLACATRPSLFVSLQPPGSSDIYEKMLAPVASALAAEGMNVRHADLRELGQIDQKSIASSWLLLLYNGCGGKTGIPSAAEVAAVTRHFDAGKNLVLVGEDDIGDAEAPGDCQSRINEFAAKWGAKFEGTLLAKSPGCLPTATTHELTSGLNLSRYTSGRLTRVATSSVAGWEETTAFQDEAGQEGFLPASASHGFVVLSSEFGGLTACSGKEYLTRIIRKSCGLKP